MQTGFNHNVKHNGRVFHVQTEDSGQKAPHIITHLFVGGNIIATKKTSYADVVGSRNLDKVVRKLMEEQHKQVMRNLIHGDYDQAVPGAAPGPPPAAAAEPAAATPVLTATVRPPTSQVTAKVSPLPIPEPPPEVVAARQLAEKPIEKPAPHDTIVGEDLLAEKSLDEVILSYLADELDGK